MDERPKKVRRRRDRIFAVLTMIIAIAWAVTAYKLAEHVKSINTARLLGAAMTGGLTDRSSIPRMQPNQVIPYLPAPPPGKSQAEIQTAQTIKQQIAYAEVIIHAWEISMYCVAEFLVLVGIVSLITRWARGLHLFAAVVIILSTIATLAAMIFLIDPEKGGLHPLSIWSYVIAASIQSAYGIILFIAFAPKPKSSAASVPQHNENQQPTPDFQTQSSGKAPQNQTELEK
ncbi:MAG: hypothetical protein JSV03_00860 [Planctomycetota bacterium]|nr:MAG: hypothetical protein JSV03_00860 [Planctomycetota bacterium]